VSTQLRRGSTAEGLSPPGEDSKKERPGTVVDVGRS